MSCEQMPILAATSRRAVSSSIPLAMRSAMGDRNRAVVRRKKWTDAEQHLRPRQMERRHNQAQLSLRPSLKPQLASSLLFLALVQPKSRARYGNQWTTSHTQVNLKHVKEFARTRVGIDAYGWLHKGTFSCALQLCKGIETNAFVEYCMYRVRMLIHFGATPVLVFDGAALPMKADTHAERRTRREEAIRKAEEAESAGRSRAAMEFYQRACGVTPAMARKLIRECRKINVEYIVAPYEADAQLAWMMQTGYVQSVITEDSDLLVYGAKRVFYKMTKDGNGDLIEMKNLPSLDGLSMVNFTEDMFVYMCVCSGCDFFKGVQGLGLKKAHALVKRYRTLGRITQAIRHDRRYSVTRSFMSDFSRACLVFRHQTVFDILKSRHVHLQELDEVARTKIPPGVLKEIQDGTFDLSFLGEHRDPLIAKRIAEGHLHPSSLEEYHEPLDIVERPVVRKVKPFTPEPLKSLPTTSNRDPPKRKGFQVQPAAGDSNGSFPVTPNLRQRLSGKPQIFNPRLAAANISRKRVSLGISKLGTPFSSSVWDKFRKPDQREAKSQFEEDRSKRPRDDKSVSLNGGVASDGSPSEEEQEPDVGTLRNKATNIGNLPPPPKRQKLGVDSGKVAALNRAVSRFATPVAKSEGPKAIAPASKATEELEVPPSPDREAYELFEKVEADLSEDVQDKSLPSLPTKTTLNPTTTKGSVKRKEVRVSRFFSQSGSRTGSPAPNNGTGLRKSRVSLEKQSRLQFRDASRKSNSLKQIDNFKRSAVGKKITTRRPGK